MTDKEYRERIHIKLTRKQLKMAKAAFEYRNSVENNSALNNKDGFRINFK